MGFGAVGANFIFKYQSFDPYQFPRTCAVLEQGLTEGVAPGFSFGVWDRSRESVIQVGVLGKKRLALGSEQGEELERDTFFDIASLTKIFATASLVALLVERRWIRWETRLVDLLPEYPDAEIRLFHLLSHTAGLPAWKPLWQQLQARFAPAPLYSVPVAVRQNEMRKFLVQIPREAPVGEKVVYSDITFLLLGFALEAVVQCSLPSAVQKFIWEPMGIKNAFFSKVTTSVEQGRHSNAAATEDCPWRGGVLQGQVHDDNAWAMGGYGGHAGVFTTSFELLKFAAQWILGFYSEQTQRAAWSRLSNPPQCEKTLGWDTPSEKNPSIGTYFSKNSVGHLGFTGTSLWIDPDAGLAVTLLSNRVHPSRENTRIREFRPRFHNALWEDLRMKKS